MKKTEKKNDGTKANVEEKKEYGVAWIVGNCKGYMGAYHDYTSYAKDARPMTKEEAETEAFKSNEGFRLASLYGCGSSIKTEFKAVFLPDEMKEKPWFLIFLFSA